METTEISKVAQTALPIHPDLMNRWSPRSFKNDALTESEIYTLMEAARWAPSSMNEQPWHFVWAQAGTPLYEQFAALLSSGNLPWASQAPALVLAFVNTQHASNGQTNRFAFYDLGAAVMALSVQAQSMHIYLHQIGGFHVENARQLLQLPAQYETAVMLAIGKRDEPYKLTEPFLTRELAPRQRKSAESFTYINTLPVW